MATKDKVFTKPTFYLYSVFLSYCEISNNSSLYALIMINTLTFPFIIVKEFFLLLFYYDIFINNIYDNFYAHIA